MPHGPVAIDRGILTSNDPSPAIAFRTFGNRLIVGRPLAQGPAGAQQGLVESYRLRPDGNLELEQVLYAPDGAAGDRFGSSLDLTESRLLVGSPLDDCGSAVDAGSAHEFVLTSSGPWSYLRRLQASDGAPNDQFGVAVALWGGSIALVGAPNATSGGLLSAGCFHYAFQGQSTPTRQDAQFPRAGARFGASIAAWSKSGNHFFLVGAPSDSSQALFGGSLHFYELSPYGPAFHLNSFVGQQPGWRIGSVMQVTGAFSDGLGFVALGVPNAESDGQPNGGRVLVHRLGWYGFEQSWTISLPGAQTGDRLGEWVGWSGERLLAIAPGAFVEDDQSTPGAFLLKRRTAEGWFTELTSGRLRDPKGGGSLNPQFALRDDTAFWDPGGADGVARIDFFPLDCQGDGSADPDLDGDGVADCTDVDDDQDGVQDAFDHCPIDRFKVAPGCLGCGWEESDADGDLFPDCGDNCLLVPNTFQEDCDGDGTGDACAVAAGSDSDLNSDGVPDRCQCLGDVDQSGEVDAIDLAQLIAGFGTDSNMADLDGSGVVNAVDLAILLSRWGACP